MSADPSKGKSAFSVAYFAMKAAAPASSERCCTRVMAENDRSDFIYTAIATAGLRSYDDRVDFSGSATCLLALAGQPLSHALIQTSDRVEEHYYPGVSYPMKPNERQDI